VAHSVICVSSY